jgi:glycine cleavage system aminomethyltransferase T
VGELGWELYVPAEFAVSVFEQLTAAGEQFGLVNAGYYAINALRLEKGYRAFGPELNPDYNPVEAGLLFATKLKTDVRFLGREAVEAAKATGVRRRAVSVVLADPDVMMWGGELVLRDGLGAGQVTSAAFATTTGACVGLAYVWRRDGDVVTTDYLQSGEWSVSVSGTSVPARVQTGAWYDPKSERIRN